MTTIQERNMATLKELFMNLGPGEERFAGACRKAMTQDVSIYNSGFPVSQGLEDYIAFYNVLNKTMGYDSNPILQWRNMWALDNKVFFERNGSAADADGKTIIDWNVFGIYEFNEEGKIFSIRDYYDNTDNYFIIAKKFGQEMADRLKATEVHPLHPDFDPNEKPFLNMQL
ncbi:MAG: hypothetical protein OXC05_04960 [Halieaceae bacterium]|nr:hypothetical protein [Halieaceae bacterium]